MINRTAGATCNPTSAGRAAEAARAVCCRRAAALADEATARMDARDGRDSLYSRTRAASR